MKIGKVTVSPSGAMEFSFNKFKIVRFHDDGTETILGSYKTYDEADYYIDEFTDKYPFAFIDIKK